MQDLGPQIGRERRYFRWLEYHRAAGRKRRHDLACDLVDRPVPGRDERAHADRLLRNQSGPPHLVELIVLEHFDAGLKVRKGASGLRLLRQPAGCTHLFGNRRCDFAVALLIFRDDVLQQLDPIGAVDPGKAGKSATRCGNRRVDVLRRAKADATDRPFCSRIDDLQGLRYDGIDPGAANIEFEIVSHGRSFLCAIPFRSGRCKPRHSSTP